MFFHSVCEGKRSRCIPASKTFHLPQDVTHVPDLPLKNPWPSLLPHDCKVPLLCGDKKILSMRCPSTICSFYKPWKPFLCGVDFSTATIVPLQRDSFFIFCTAFRQNNSYILPKAHKRLKKKLTPPHLPRFPSRFPLYTGAFYLQGKAKKK